MKNSNIIKQVIAGGVLLVIGASIGWNYYLSTPSGTINQIKSTADKGDYEAFKNCCFDESLVFENIRQDINNSLEEGEGILYREVVNDEIELAKTGFKADFSQSKLFNEISADTIAKTDNGFTIEAKGKAGNTNLITFQDMNKGRFSFANYKIVEIKTVD